MTFFPGLPALSEQTEINHDIQIKKIKQVLISSIESNSKAWAPVIFQVWSKTLQFSLKIIEKNCLKLPQFDEQEI